MFILPILFALTSDPRLQEPAATPPITVRANVHTASRQDKAALDSSAGRVVMVWESRRQERGSDGVYARAFDLLGRPLTHEMRANATLAGMQGRPAAAMLPDGGAWIAWESFGQDGSGAAAVARRFDANLQPLGEELLLSETAHGDQGEVALACGADGAVLATWSVADAAGARLCGRLLHADGRMGEVLEFSAAVGAEDRLPAVSACGTGYALAWSRRERAADSARLWLLRLDASGAAAGAPVAVDASEAADQIEPSVDGDAAGRLVVGWMQSTSQGYAVRARRFAADGAPVAAAWTTAPAGAGWNSGVAVALAPDGSCTVTWNRDRAAGQGETIHHSQFDAEGALRASGTWRDLGRGVQATTASGNARRMRHTAEGALLLAWNGDAALGDETGAHLSLLTPAGLAVAPAPDLGPAQTAPAVSDAEFHAAIPPIYDPNWVPQPPFARATPGGSDFGFEGVPGTGWTPPDPEMAVGTQHVVVMTNGQIACFDKSGVNLWRDEIEGGFGFWGAQGATGFVFDPEAKWDPHSQRYVVMACERSSNARSTFLLAISKDDTPTTAADWWKYRLDVTALAGDDIDSPNLAVNADTILLTADFFSPDAYLIYLVDKASVLNGGAPVTASDLISGTGQQSMGIPVVYDAGGILYILQSTEFSTNTTVIFHAIQNPFTAYSRVTRTVSVQSYTYPNQPPQKGSSSRPFLFEPRFWSVAQRNGALWAVHHVNSSRARVRWYEFALNGWPTSGSFPSVTQSGELDYGDQIHTYFPSIHVDADDNAAITFARSSPTEFISIGRALRGAGDPVNTFRPMQVVQTSDNAHTSGRWGDYSGTHADDAAGPGVFWGHHEFTSGTTGSWRTWVARYVLDAAPFRLDVPAVINAGAVANLTITGATPGGSVQLFYTETGPGLTLLGAYGAYCSLEAPLAGPVRSANANGVATISRQLPAAFAGRTFWLQAMEAGRASNWEKRTIQ